MFSRSANFFSLKNIEIGRLALSQQFATMNGWQSSQEDRFDRFVEEKRRKEHYEAFDQRVERAYLVMVKQHKTEIWNGAKRKLKTTAAKYNSDVLRDVEDQIEERTQWLRDVWTQINSDYISTDTYRQERAAKEISKALRGDPTDYHARALEMKHNARFKGPVGQSEVEALIEQADMPSISNEEANRYHSLKMNMTEMEKEVVHKYGLAGETHWRELQEIKDREYMDKMERAQEVYKRLMDQQLSYDEAKEQQNLQNDVKRAGRAQIRFKAAMELEKEREKLMEAHNAMKKEREELVMVQRRMQLKQAAELRRQGKSSEEVIMWLKQQNLDKEIQRSNVQLQREKEQVTKTKKTYIQLIEQLRDSAERREGEAMLSQGADRRFDMLNLDSDDKSEALEENKEGSMPVPLWEEAKKLSQSEHKSYLEAQETQRKLWDIINGDKEDEPFRAVHQARIDSQKTHSDIYAKTIPTNMAITVKGYQGDGRYAAGNNQDRYIQQDVYSMTEAMQWGVMRTHDLDLTKNKEYVSGDQWHVRDPQTGDIDWRYEKKGGGPVFNAPRFYKPGIEYDKNRPQEQSIYQTPKPTKRHKTPGLGTKAMLDEFDRATREQTKNASSEFSLVGESGQGVVNFRHGTGRSK